MNNPKPLFILLFLFITYPFVSNALNPIDYKIDKRIILQTGLSQSRIKSIVEDKRGFIWFGTEDGLNRYDGYTFKIFKNKINDSTSLPNNTINSMVLDNIGNIWLGTNNGVVIFNPYTETFTSLSETDSILISEGANIIKTCVVDKQNNIWCGTQGNGIFKINSQTLEKEKLHNNGDSSLYLDQISTLYVDSKNRLWIGSHIDYQVIAYDIYNNKFKKYNIGEFSKNESKRLTVQSVFEDNEGRILIGLVDYKWFLGGLFYLEEGQKNFHSYHKFLPQDYISLNSDRLNTIMSIVGDNDGNIWITSILNGVYKFKFGSIPIPYFVQSPLVDARINLIFLSNNGILWVGTNGNGIEISIPNNTDFKLMNNEINSGFLIESIRAFSEDDNYYWVGGYYGLSKIKKDFSEATTVYPASIYAIKNSTNNSNILWTGSEGGGLQQFNKNTTTFLDAKFSIKKPGMAVPNYVYAIYPINDTLTLLGTPQGIIGFNPVSLTMTPYPGFNSKANKTTRTIYKDRSGNILVGFLQGGIGILDLNKKRIDKFKLIPNLYGTSGYNPVNSIYNDAKNRYWIATNNGLFMYNPAGNKSKLFTESDGLPDSHIYGILPDEDGNLWLSTNNGLSSYSTIEGVFNNYDFTDGLQNNEFNTGAYFKAQDGTLFFGGISGFNYFNPKDIKQNSIIPKIVITGIKIGNKYLKIDKKQTLLQTLTILPTQEVFTIEFAGLSFINSDRNKYKYRIEELGREWIHLGNQHSITFSNLQPDTYTLSILASNNHGLWTTQPYKLTIKILPSFVESLLFKWLLVVTIFVIVIVGYGFRLRGITKKKNEIQIFADLQTTNLRVTNNTLKKEIEKHLATSQALKATNKTKDKFLSIMAHDIINPLGVIMGFSDLLIDEANDFSEEDKSSFLKTINVTTKGLTSLLSNLLQWSRLQSGTISAKPQQIQFNTFVVETLNLLNANIAEKSITIHNNVADNINVYTDPDMLSTVLRNLVSNAIKFTPNKGKIIINATSNGKTTEVNIIDNGVGISNENMSKLFNPNNNISTKGTNNESGTGLGLGLVYEFIQMNGGKVWVESEIGVGSEFSFVIPATS